ncbi:MAG: 4Fe-4S binding protein [Sulfolobales archaeon]
MSYETVRYRDPLEELIWIIIHGRGVWHTGPASTFARILATAGTVAGRDSYYYMRYDDSPERNNVPMIWYVVMGTPKVNVILPEEPEPIGDLFNAVVVMDSTLLLKETSQRGYMFDGVKNNSVFVVNTGLEPSQIIYLLKKYQLTKDWSGKLVTVSASKYHKNIAFGLLGALVKVFEIISLDHVATAMEVLKFDRESIEAVKNAYDEAVVTNVSLSVKESELVRVRVKPPEFRPGPWDLATYREYQKAFSQARSYEDRLKSLPRWETLAPGLIEFGPLPGEKNLGFTTAFSRFQAPIIDMKRCIDCKLCHLYCPEGAIDFRTITVDWNYCTGCGICSTVCPTKAITMVSELERLEGMKDPEVEKLALAVREYGF